MNYRALAGIFLLLCGPAQAARQIMDDAGNQIQLPDKVTHIADGWFAHPTLLMALGAGNQITATADRPADHPWMFRIQPSLNKALLAHGTTFNSEELLARGTDVMFVAKGNPDAASYRQATIPTVEISFNDFPSMQKALILTAQVLGTPEAKARAAAYNHYLDQQVTTLSARTAHLSIQQRPGVLHIQSLNPLKVDGSGTLIDSWIKLAGGRNAAGSVKGNMKEVSPELILSWQPDIIILGSGCGTLANSRYGELFASLPAVKNGKVWANPAGVFPWDRYGVESALQIQWAATRLHPELFRDIDIIARTRDFYRQFFNYPLNADEAQRILAGLPPRT